MDVSISRMCAFEYHYWTRMLTKGHIETPSGTWCVRECSYLGWDALYIRSLLLSNSVWTSRFNSQCRSITPGCPS